MVKYENENATYEMNADPVNKVLQLKATGFFGEEDGSSFLKDYDAIVKTFSAKDYVLILDGMELKPSSPKVAGMLGVLLEKYMTVPFKKRIFVTKGNAITIMQLKRLGSSIPGWNEGVEYVDTYPEALIKSKN